MHNQQLAKAYLKKDTLLYMAMTETLCRNNAQIIYAGEDGIAMINKQSNDLHLAIEDDQTLMRLLPQISLQHGIVLYNIHQQALLEGAGYQSLLPPAAVSAYLDDDITIPYIKGLQCLRLQPEHLPALQEHYQLIDNTQYLQERLAAGMLGAFYRGQLAGFAGLHDDGSLGMLEVFPAFRRRGFGSALTCHLVHLELCRGHVPFGYCLLSNKASIAMQKKLGFSLSSSPIMMFQHKSNLEKHT